MDPYVAAAAAARHRGGGGERRRRGGAHARRRTGEAITGHSNMFREGTRMRLHAVVSESRAALESLGSEEHLLARLDELGELARSTGRAS